MKMRWMLCALLVLGAVSCKRFRRGGGGGGGAVGTAAPQNDNERALYALGMLMGQRIGEFNLSRHELAVVQRGLVDQVTGARPLVEVQRYAPRLRELSMQRQQAGSAQTRQRGAAYAEQAAREPGAQRLPSGLVYRELAAGTGAQPTASDEVTVNYRGTLIDGTEFDSSYGRGEPATFPLNGVIPCWTEGVQRMRVGGRARLVCPSEIAYGDRAQRQIPAGSTLIFEIELMNIRGRDLPDASGPAEN